MICQAECNRMKKILSRIVSAMVLVLPMISCAQGITSDGRDYYLGLVYPSFNAQSLNLYGKNVQGFFGVYALISSYDDNVVTVGYFDNNGNEINKQKYNVMKRRAIQVPLDVAHMKPTTDGQQAEWKSCHITAIRDISVQYFSTGSCSGGSYLALPTPMLGKEYIVSAYHDNTNGYGNGTLSNENGRGFFQILAVYDGTHVTITPSTTTAKGNSGVHSGSGSNGVDRYPFTVDLHRGQTYTVFSSGLDPSYDISGTSIVSTKPVAVLAGNENAFVDGGDPKPTGTGLVDARDYMVEQMLPVSMFDTTGYYSIPLFANTGPGTVYGGDSYQVVSSSDTTAANVAERGGAVLRMDVGPFEAQEDPEVEAPASYTGLNGQPFGVMQYEHRFQNTSAPQMAPSMMSVVSRSHWKRSYLEYVPNNTFEISQGYYVNLICRRVDYDNDSIQVGRDGGKPTSIRAAGYGLKARFNTIPGAPDLVGISLAVSPGSIYFSTLASEPFMVYNYGFRAIDPDRDLGDNDEDDFYFSYAAPAGCMTAPQPNSLIITVDTLCASWRICIRDTSKIVQGIKSLQILDDPSGDFFKPGRVYHNVQFDPAVDPDGTREIDLPGNDTAYCATVQVSSPLDTAYAPIVIITADGGWYLVEMRYAAPRLQLAVSPNVPNQRDSIIFPVTAPQSDTCVTIWYFNRAKAGDPGLDLVSATLKHNDGNFRIGNITRTLPMRLAPGDSLGVTVCFNPQDAKFNVDNPPRHADSVVLTTGCFVAPMTLVGPVGSPLIYATDRDFGYVVVGTTRCDTVTIRNIGTLPFTLTDSVIHATIAGNHDFTWDQSSKYNTNRLPAVLQPGQFVRIAFCFAPTLEGYDSTTVSWKTNVQGTYRDSTKTYSALKGFGIKPGVVWDRLTDVEFIDSSANVAADTFLVNLTNPNSAVTHVRSVYFTGTDVDEFLELDNQDGYVPLEGFQMSPGNTLWVRLVWTPNLSRGYRDRHVRLVATFDVPPSGLDSTVMDITGTFDQRFRNSVRAVAAAPGSIYAYAADRRLYLRLPKDGGPVTAIELYDVLGRRMFDWSGSAEPDAEGGLIVPTPQLASGLYVIRVASRNVVRSAKLVKP